MNDYIKQQLEEIDKKIEAAREMLGDPELSSLAQAEILKLERQKQELSSVPQIAQSGTPRNDVAIIEIRSATGGDEAGLFAGDLLRMYTKFAQNKGFRIEELNRSEGKLGQIKEVVLKITGKDSYKTLQNESGVHRVQRVPVTESSGRIHTSTATVAVLPEVTAREINTNPQDLQFEAFRSGGKGGQNVNKVSTAVRIKHIPTGMVVTAQSQRFQAQNREIAMDLLRSKLWQMQEEKRQERISGERSTQIGSGKRSEKIRTYNFPQNRVTDHRINKSWHNLEEIMDGDLEPVITTAQAALAK